MHHPAVALLERILELSEKVGGQRELARRAGLRDERHVGVIVSRLRRNAGADIERETLTALARGGGVSVEWLARGEDDARTPSTSESVAPHMANAIGFDDALAEAQRRDAARPLAARVRPHAWEAVARSGRYEIRGRVTADDILKLARVYEELADPARLAQLADDQARRIAELEAELEAERAAKARARARSAPKAKGRGAR